MKTKAWHNQDDVIKDKATYKGNNCPKCINSYYDGLGLACKKFKQWEKCRYEERMGDNKKGVL